MCDHNLIPYRIEVNLDSENEIKSYKCLKCGKEIWKNLNN